MKRFLSIAFSGLLVGTVFATSVFAEGLDVKVGKEKVVGRLDEQWASTVTISEEKKDSWKEKTNFKLVLPQGIDWNEKTSVDGKLQSSNDVKIDKGTLTFTYDKADEEKLDKFYISPYVNISRDVKPGDLELDIYVNNEKKPTTVKIGKISDYGVSISSDEKIYQVNNKEAEVYFELGELIENTFAGETMGTITLENAEIVKDSIQIKKLAGDKEATVKTVNGDYFDFNISKGSNVSKWGFSLKINPKEEFTGDIYAKFESHQGLEPQQALVATIESPLEFTTRKPTPIILGKTNQEIENVVFEETRGGSLAEGDYTLKITPDYKGLSFNKDLKFDYDKNDMSIKNVKVDGNKIHFTVGSESRRPQKITLTNLKADIDRSGLDGNYTMELVSDKNPDAVIAKTVLFSINLAEEKKEEVIEKDDFNKKIVFKIDEKKFTIENIKDNTKEEKDLDAPAFVDGGRTFLPVRAVSESLGLNVDWNKKAKTATVTSSEKGVKTTVVLTIDNKDILVDGKVKTIDVAPKIKDGRTVLPIRHVIEPFGYGESKILWDANTKTITILD